MKRLYLFLLIIVLIFALTIGMAGCSFIREGVTGEKQAQTTPDTGTDQTLPTVPAAFNIIGNWFGIYSLDEYLSFRFTADGKCELQPASYPADMLGPRYYGDYRWGGDNGNEITVDMYKGVSRSIDYGEGNVREEWSDGGRDSATTGLNMTFQVYGGSMKSVAMKAAVAGIDTDGYTVVSAETFVVLMAETTTGSGNPSKFWFGMAPPDLTEGKLLLAVPPDTLADKAQRFYTTAELNVRSGPDTKYGTYGTVPPGTAVDKIGSMWTGHDDWAFVLLQDGGGWVNTGYLADSPPAPADDTSANQ